MKIQNDESRASLTGSGDPAVGGAIIRGCTDLARASVRLAVGSLVESQMRLVDLFLFLQESAEHRSITIYPQLIKVLGGLKATIFFTNIVQWLPANERTKEIYKTSDEIEEETGLTFKEQRNARKKLRELKVLKERNAWLEHRVYYALDLDGLDALLGSDIEISEMTKGQPPDVPKVSLQNAQRAISRLTKGQSDIRNKKVTRELQESTTSKKEAATPPPSKEETRSWYEVCNRLFESDKTRFMRLIVWVKDCEKQRYGADTIRDVLLSFEYREKRSGRIDGEWWPWLTAAIKKMVDRDRIRAVEAEHERNKREEAEWLKRDPTGIGTTLKSF